MVIFYYLIFTDNPNLFLLKPHIFSLALIKFNKFLKNKLPYNVDK